MAHQGTSQKSKLEKHKTASGLEYEVGSDNIFADLGLPDPEALLLKAQLAIQVRELVQERGLTQAQVAQLTGITQPRVSRLLNGHMGDFSVERLFFILQRLGYPVEVRISKRVVQPQQAQPRVLVAS